MGLAGETVIAGKVPGERIATDVRTDTVSAFTSETEVQSVTAPVVQGRIYKVAVSCHIAGSGGDERVGMRIRRDTDSGVQLVYRQLFISHTSSFGHFVHMEVEFTAHATEDTTFVFTAARASGSGNLSSDAVSNRPAYMYVDYIRG